MAEIDLRMYYGAWYVEPEDWQVMMIIAMMMMMMIIAMMMMMMMMMQVRHGRQLDTKGGAERVDHTKAGNIWRNNS